MSDGEAFREWFESKLKDARETNDKDFHASLSRYVGFYQYGFEAAWYVQQNRIDEIELKIGKLECLEHDDELIVETIKSLQAKIDELEAQLSILKPNPLCDTSCLLSCKMEADALEHERANLLEAKLAIAVEALERIADPYATGEHLIANEALNKIRKIGE